MASKTNYLEKKLLDHVLRVAAFTQPAGLYLALFSTATDDTGAGTEATGGAYARQAITFAASVSGSGQSLSSATVSFTMPAGTWTYAAIFDAVTGGNMLYQGQLVSPITTTAGQVVPFNAGDVVVSED